MSASQDKQVSLGDFFCGVITWLGSRGAIRFVTYKSSIGNLSFFNNIPKVFWTAGMNSKAQVRNNRAFLAARSSSLEAPKRLPKNPKFSNRQSQGAPEARR
jgi:hypothetical protein